MTTSTDNLAATACLSLSRSSANDRNSDQRPHLVFQSKYFHRGAPPPLLLVLSKHHHLAPILLSAPRESTPGYGCTAIPAALPARTEKELSNTSSCTSWASRAPKSTAELESQQDTKDLAWSLGGVFIRHRPRGLGDNKEWITSNSSSLDVLPFD